MPLKGRLICSCNNVGEGNLEDLIKDGCCELEALCSKSGAGAGCGSCRPEVKRVLETTEIPIEAEVEETK